MSTLAVIPGAKSDRGDLDALADSFAIFVRGEGLADSTCSNYDKSIRVFIEWCVEGNAPVLGAEFRRRHLAAYMAYVAETPTLKGTLPRRSSVATVYRHLQQWFRWMVEEKEIEASPLAHLKAQQPDEAPVPVYDIDNIKALLDGCSDDLWGRRDEAIIRILLDAGPRIAEVAGMDLADVRLKHQVIRVVGKGRNGARRERDIPLGKKTVRALDRYIRARARHPRAESPELWLGYRHRRPTTGGLAKMLERRCVRAGVEHVNPHKLRHTFAHLFRLGGGEAHHLMSIGGWDSEQMVRRYGRSAIAYEAAKRHAEISPGDAL